MRVSNKTANYIVEMYENSEFFRSSNIGHFVIPAKKQIYAFLWFAGNKCCYKQVAILFNTPITYANKSLNKVLDFFSEISENIIKFPETEQQKIEAAKKFEQIAGFKNVIGCIDRCNIDISKSAANKIRPAYKNQNHMSSIKLQAICDADEKFIDICVASPSTITDARLLDLSPINDKLESICGYGFHLLGDDAYPELEYLSTPVRSRGTNNEKNILYNKKHRQTRDKIEDAFASLKQRFRQLDSLDLPEVERMCKFVLACCVVHNICIEQCDEFYSTLNNEPELLVSTETAQTCKRPKNDMEICGEAKRERILESL